MAHILSKSTFLYGSQCPKRLHYYKFRRDLIQEISESQQAVFDRGTSVGQLARDLFPGGIDASPDSPYLYAKSVRYTAELIASGAKIIYEACFEYDGVLAAVDILVNRNGRWKAYEVKSSTSVKEVNLLDAALQYHVITNSGIQLTDIFIVHLNNEYVRKKSLVIEELFKIESVRESAVNLQESVRSNIIDLKKMLATKREPESNIGPHCSDPYTCDFIHHCWSHIPSPSVFDISGLRGDKKFHLYESGRLRFEEIPEDFKLNEYQQMQVQCHLENKIHIDKDAIREFIKAIEYPLHFLDFESFQPAVPLYPKSRSYQQIPFQYSLHSKKSKKSQVTHKEFLAAAGTEDPRIPFIEKLLDDTLSSGTILCYNAAFEKMILNSIARDFPAYREDVQDLVLRIADLMIPFRKGWYYKPEMNGSYSIKEVLPAIVPELNYEDLEIADGSSASIAFEEMIHNPHMETETVRKNLLEYCKLDTYAMVRLMEVLEKV